jgi:hypothetical protein
LASVLDCDPCTAACSVATANIILSPAVCIVHFEVKGHSRICVHHGIIIINIIIRSCYVMAAFINSERVSIVDFRYA